MKLAADRNANVAALYDRSDSPLQDAAYPTLRDAIPSFSPGAMIATRDGELPVEWLETGDEILTRDHGFQPVMWLGRSRQTASKSADLRICEPVRLAPSAVEPDMPHLPLDVSADTRILIASPLAELHFGAEEVLACASAWVEAGLAQFAPSKREQSRVHVACAQPEVIMVENLWVETMVPTAGALAALDHMSLRRFQAEGQTTDFDHMSLRPHISDQEAQILLASAAMEQATKQTQRGAA